MSSCSQSQIFAGTCDVSAGLGDGEAVLEGNGTIPGSGGSSGNGGGGSDAGTVADIDYECEIPVGDRCYGEGPARPVDSQPVTMSDIASFRPDPGIDAMEPNGWMIVGLNTNFFATGGVQIKDGSLLGQPASVRFTPIRWNWTYGDGSAASRGTAGATWASQGIREFDPTATSHIYRAPGTYYIDLSIDFAAEYRLAGMPWARIAGTLNVPANRLIASAGDAKTVLVERECTINPAGPGC